MFQITMIIVVYFLANIHGKMSCLTPEFDMSTDRENTRTCFEGSFKALYTHLGLLFIDRKVYFILGVPLHASWATPPRIARNPSPPPSR